MPLANTSRFPFLLLALYAAEFIVLAFHPVDRSTWLVENATVWIIVGVIAGLYVGRIRFSNLAYGLMAVLIYLHTIGGHWTFAQVPFGWVTEALGFERDNFDRIAHFTVGFYAYAIAEWIWARRLVRNRWLLASYPVFAIGTLAMAYELVEWIFAITAAPEAGAAYLGSQGDIWDAQKDMLADTLGAIAATVLFFGVHGPRRLRNDLAEG